MKIDELSDIYGETFSQGSLADKQFTKNNLNANGYLYIQDVLPGCFTVIDNNNKVVLVQQYQHIENNMCVGVDIDLKDFNIYGVWKIRYNRGMRGQEGSLISEKPPTEDIIKYALVFS